MVEGQEAKIARIDERTELMSKALVQFMEEDKRMHQTINRILLILSAVVLVDFLGGDEALRAMVMAIAGVTI